MPIVTAQLLARLYEQYKTTEVTFNRQVTAATGLVTRNVYLKIADRQLPCSVVSSSLVGARVAAAVTDAIQSAITQAGNRVTLRWCFKLPDKVEPITFFVPCHATGFAPYDTPEPGMQMIILEYVQRPADDLILIVGSLLEANINASRRKDERITITPEAMKKLGFESREATLIVDKSGRRCVLRDVSFGGFKVITGGRAESFQNQRVILKIYRGGMGADLFLTGTVRRAEEVGGHKEIIALGVELVGEIPMPYKLLISSYLSSVRKQAGDQQQPAGAHASAGAAPGAGPASAAPAAPVPPASREIPDEEPPETNAAPTKHG